MLGNFLTLPSFSPMRHSDATPLNVSNCVNNNYTTFASGTPTGFNVTSDGLSFQSAGTADEIPYIDTKKYRITFDLVLNSGSLPAFTLRDALGGNQINVGGYIEIFEGSNDVTIEVNSTTTGVIMFHNSSTATDYEITNLSIVCIS